MSEDIDFAIKKAKFAKDIRKSLRNRMIAIQIISVILIIYLILFPIFDFFVKLIPNSTTREVPALNTMIFFATLFVITLIIGVARSKPQWGSYLFLFVFWVAISAEWNPFILAFKYCVALFFYEMPFIMNYYSNILNGYKSYSSQHINELEKLRKLFDQHMTYSLSLIGLLLAITWSFVLVVDVIKIDIGQEAGFTIPFVIILCLSILAFVRSDVSKTLYQFQRRKREPFLLLEGEDEYTFENRDVLEHLNK